jgi:hypothetical protein
MSGEAAKAVLECSERMLAAASAGRWEELVQLERERRELLEDMFEPGAALEPDMLRRLVEINEEIVALGKSHRDELRRELEDGRAQRRAADAYRVGAG